MRTWMFALTTLLVMVCCKSSEPEPPFMESCIEPLVESVGEDKAHAVCTCVAEKCTAAWGPDHTKWAGVGPTHRRKFRQIARDCRNADPIGAVSTQDGQPTPASHSTPTVVEDTRSAFVKVCSVPPIGKLGKEKSEKLCGCIYDKGTAQWTLEQLSEMGSQNPTFQKLIIECMAQI